MFFIFSVPPIIVAALILYCIVHANDNSPKLKLLKFLPDSTLKQNINKYFTVQCIHKKEITERCFALRLCLIAKKKTIDNLIIELAAYNKDGRIQNCAPLRIDVGCLSKSKSTIIESEYTSDWYYYNNIIDEVRLIKVKIKYIDGAIIEF